MRATAENPRVAGLMGVNPNFVIAATFAIGAALAAVAGVMIASELQHRALLRWASSRASRPSPRRCSAVSATSPARWSAACCSALIESLGAGYIGDLTGGFFGSHYQDIFAFVVLIIVLLFRPSGIMGERVADRA